MTSGSAHFGVVGLAVMGQNLARNLARHGVPVVAFNRTPARTRSFIERFGGEGPLEPAETPEELVGRIAQPRAILMMVQAGPAVDETIDHLAPLLSTGDVLIDGGNSLYTDTQRRVHAVEGRGLRYLGTGVSGGEEGALNGPSIMPGGTREAYELVQGPLTAIAARAPDGSPCCTYIGPDGAGHYVKMVHNGIEYADMQLIAEAYDLLRHALGLDVETLAGVFADWNRGDLELYLIEITAAVLRKHDEATGRPLVDVILDEAMQKGTGTWTSKAALDLGMPVTAITEAVFARGLSAMRDQRLAASGVLPGPPSSTARVSDELIADVRHALYASKVVAYAQGFQQLAAASDEFGWDLDLRAIASIWRAGCIIRARFLDRIMDAYERDPSLKNLMLAPYFRDAIASSEAAWRRVVRLAVEVGVPSPAFSSALSYFDGYRRGLSPASLIQGLRDYFGAHTYRRLDRPGSFHTRWAQDGAEVEV